MEMRKNLSVDEHVWQRLKLCQRVDGLSSLSDTILHVMNLAGRDKNWQSRVEGKLKEEQGR